MTPQKKYNVLLLVSDQQRRDSLGAYGNPEVKTPHIDRLAGNGVCFTQAYTPCAVCMPARASLLTGLLPHKHGAKTNGSNLVPGIPTLSDFISEEYKLGFAGKWHVDNEKGPTEYGFKGKDFLGYAYPGSGVFGNINFPQKPRTEPNHYRDYLRERNLPVPELSEKSFVSNPGNSKREFYGLQSGTEEASIPYFVAEETRSLISSLAPASSEDKPFFIWSNFWGPHNPCFIPEPWFSMYDPDTIPATGDPADFTGKPGVQKVISKYWGLDQADKKTWQNNIAKYWGYASLIDAQVGRIVDHLNQSGLAENTIVIYTADHGDMLGHHGLIDKGPFMYDDTYNIPFIVYHPDIQEKGRKSEAFIYLHDILPTLIELANLPPSAELDGKSILPTLVDSMPDEDFRSEVVCQFEAQLVPFTQRMIRTREYKFIYNQADTSELYHMIDDPAENRNLIGDDEHKPALDDLKTRLLASMEKTNDPLAKWYRQVVPTL